MKWDGPMWPHEKPKQASALEAAMDRVVRLSVRCDLALPVDIDELLTDGYVIVMHGRKRPHGVVRCLSCHPDVPWRVVLEELNLVKDQP